MALAFFNANALICLHWLGNSVAHMLARWAFESESFVVCMETIPPDISAIYNFDLNKI